MQTNDPTEAPPPANLAKATELADVLAVAQRELDAAEAASHEAYLRADKAAAAVDDAQRALTDYLLGGA